MRNFILSVFFVMMFIIISCTSDRKPDTTNTTKIDTAKVIEESVNYILKTEQFAPEYYTDTLKIVKSKNVSANTRFMLNGIMSKQVNERPRLQVLNDWNHPKLYLEVIGLKRVSDHTIYINLLFRTTGNEFEIWIEEEKSNTLKIDSISHGNIKS